MKRTYIWLFLVMVFTSTLLCSCSKDDNSDDGEVLTIKASNVSYSTSQIETVKAVVCDFDSESYYDREYVIADAQFKNNGFSLELPASLPSSYLYLLWEEVPNGITISDEDAKICDLFICGYDKDENEIGDFYLGNEDDDTDVFWIYSDRTFTVKGEGKVINYDFDEEIIFNYNIELHRGWDIIYITTTHDYNETSDRDIYTEVAKSQKPSGLDVSWYFEGWDMDYLPANNAKSASKQNTFFKKLKESRMSKISNQSAVVK